MKNYTDKLLDNLSDHIDKFEKDKINNWLEEAAKQFNCHIVEEGQHLLMKLNEPDKYENIGPHFGGNNREEKEINMFHHFINYHYGFIKEGNFVANLNFENDVKYPVFG